MGMCCSAERETQNDSHNGGNGNETSKSRSKVPSAIQPSVSQINGERKGGNGNETSKSRNKVSSAIQPSVSQINGEILESPNLKIFSYNELKEATDNFGPDAVLGKGDFGSVYKGWIDEQSLKAAWPKTGMAVAVKKLSQRGCQGQQEWLAEIKYLGRLYHPNLVKLIGYCLEDEHRLLVYEFMPNGNLEKCLFSRDSHIKPLSWRLLMQVALGAATCLAFLHCKAGVIYRGFKTSDILLDANHNAILSDFGLARDGPPGNESHVSTRVLGTEGYAAPEYVRTGHLSAKSDVYSFGIVLLEMISGRQAIERDKPSEEQNLGNWARRCSTRKFSQFLNPDISCQNATADMIKIAQLAVKCVSVEPKLRPNMEEVVGILEKVQDFSDRKRGTGSKHYKSINSSIYTLKIVE